MYNKLVFLFITTICLCCSCSDDDTAPVGADDNFVTSVILTVNETDYLAVIGQNTITVTVPYNVSLKDARTVFSYSELATIVPAPETIKNWEEELTFRVTSYNGKANEYTYKVIKDDIRHEGNIDLKTPAEVAAFAERDVTIVEGDLIIGSDRKEEEAITDLSALSLLKEVRGNIIIRKSYTGVDLAGLENITSIGGLQMRHNNPMQIVTLKSLEKVTGDVWLNNQNLVYVIFENLVSVGGSFLFNSSAVQTFDLPKLMDIESDCIIEGYYTEAGETKHGGTITALKLPELKTVGGKLSVNGLANLISISFPKLTTAGGIDFSTIPVLLETIELPEVTVVNGDLLIIANLVEDGFFSILNHALMEITGLDKLTVVKGQLSIVNFQELKQLPDFSNITLLGGLRLRFLPGLEMQELDLSRTDFEPYNDIAPSIEILSKAYIPKITTKEDLSHVDIILESGTLAYPEMNFKSVKNFSHTCTHKTDPVYQFSEITGNLSINRSTMMKGCAAPYLTKVGGYMSLQFGFGRNISFPLLETVEGQLYLTGVNSTPDFPKLEQVCCAAQPVYYRVTREDDLIPAGGLDVSAAGQHLSFPALKQIGGGLTLHGVKTVSCSKLTTIKGAFSVEKASTLTVVDLPDLKTISGLHFNTLRAFEDFTFFGKFIDDGQITAANWSVRQCKYNPGYQDMVNKKYKP